MTRTAAFRYPAMRVTTGPGLTPLERPSSRGPGGTGGPAPCGRGIAPRIARRGIEASQRLGRHRWVVERTMSWLSGCRRLHRRYERKPEHFLAFAAIATSLINYRRLTK